MALQLLLEQGTGPALRDIEPVLGGFAAVAYLMVWENLACALSARDAAAERSVRYVGVLLLSLTGPLAVLYVQPRIRAG